MENVIHRMCIIYQFGDRNESHIRVSTSARSSETDGGALNILKMRTQKSWQHLKFNTRKRRYIRISIE